MITEDKVKVPTPEAWLKEDERKAAEPFARMFHGDLGVSGLAVERYVSPDFHRREMEKLWPHVWQMACHESEIPEVGAHVTYEIGKRSFIVVRTGPDEIKAYVNACLHRGMRLAKGAGEGMAFTCTFHGWSWNLDGTLRRLTESWDFPQCRGEDLNLPEAKGGLWGGFVFINPDRDAEPFERYVGELTEQFAADPLENRRIAVHAARVIGANWKIAQEAFIESYHVSPTHPQSVPVSEYAESQYDIYPASPNISRLYTVSVAPVAPGTRAMTPQQFGDFAAKATMREPVQVPLGQTYRRVLAEARRREIATVPGQDVAHLTDSEMLDAIQYFLFPNFLPWYGYGVPIAYRFRPNGDRHDSCIMEVYVFAPRDLTKPTPPAPPVLWVSEDEPFAAHEALGRLGPIFDQDLTNIEGVQAGLEATEAKEVILARYQEMRIRHYHRLIDDYLGRGVAPHTKKPLPASAVKPAPIHASERTQ